MSHMAQRKHTVKEKIDRENQLQQTNTGRQKMWKGEQYE